MTSEPRNWLCIITSEREEENIDEMTRDIWTHFDGIAAVVHKQGSGTAVSDLLKERCKSGFIKEIEWKWHHGQSMNEWLLDHRIRAMDACWIRDSCERFNPTFTSDIRGFSAGLLGQNVWNLAQWSKLLMFRRWYNQQFFGGMHWGLSGLYGPTISTEQLGGFESERDHAYSVRKEKRPSTHRYRHEVLYLLDYQLNGNHLALFHKDAHDLDAAQWRLHEFIQYLEERGVHGVDALTEWLKKQNPLDSQVKSWLNEERPFRNLYRFYILGHTNEEIEADEDVWRIE